MVPRVAGGQPEHPLDHPCLHLDCFHLLNWMLEHVGAGRQVEWRKTFIPIVDCWLDVRPHLVGFSLIVMMPWWQLKVGRRFSQCNIVGIHQLSRSAACLCLLTNAEARWSQHLRNGQFSRSLTCRLAALEPSVLLDGCFAWLGAVPSPLA